MSILKTSKPNNFYIFQGHIIALEKIKSKVEKLKRNVEKFACKNVQVFCFDSTKAVSVEIKSDLCNSPPFLMETFDRILLDGPCSGLGQRPQIRNFITAPQLASYVALQRKLFSQVEFWITLSLKNWNIIKLKKKYFFKICPFCKTKKIYIRPGWYH